MSKTYAPEPPPDFLRLRELHAAMARAILGAFGWADLNPTCDFLLDYEQDDEDESGGRRCRKEPWRYRWADDVHNEVLARLPDLNRRRAEDERPSGAAAEAGTGKGRKKGTGSRKGAREATAQPKLFGS